MLINKCCKILFFHCHAHLTSPVTKCIFSCFMFVHILESKNTTVSYVIMYSKHAFRVQNTAVTDTYRPKTSIPVFCGGINASTKPQPITQFFVCVFSEKVLGVVNSKGLDDPGPVRWPLALCLLAAWVVIFLCMLKGIRSSGKVRPHPDRDPQHIQVASFPIGKYV